MAKTGKQGPDNGTYDVGYGKPPKHTQWKHGHSGNPKGRPKGAKNLKTVIEEEALSKITISEGGKTKKVSKMAALIKMLTVMGIKGDTKAANSALALIEKHLPDLDSETAVMAPASAEELKILESHAAFLTLVENAKKGQKK